jgi:predicted nuclease with TOPRIM domain
MSDAGNLLPRAAGNGNRGGHERAQDGDLVGLLEERVTGLVDRYRGSQKGAEELRSRLDAAEAEIGALHARLEETERLRGELRDRVVLLIDQVRRLETDSVAESEDDD